MPCLMRLTSKMKKRIGRLLVVLGSIVLIFTLLIVGFLYFWKPLGGMPSEEQLQEYAKRSEYFADGAFQNMDYVGIYAGGESDYDGSNRLAPGPIPVHHLDSIPRAKQGELKWIWFGHSSSMVQLGEVNILIDPIFSDYASPIQLPVVVNKRMSELPIEPENMPEIDIVLISHDHYDHLDYDTIQKIDDKVKKYVVPLGVSCHLIRFGVPEEKIVELAWWEDVTISGCNITATPGQHYSNRLQWDKNKTLWCGFAVKDADYQFYFTGDTGYNTFFQEIGEKLGEVDLLIVENGQYDKRWSKSHMFPEQSVSVAEHVHAKWTVPVHWGTFSICIHPWDDSIKRFSKAATEQGIHFATPRIGEVVDYEHISEYNEKWWEEVK